jgi:hypothetical protein
MFKMVITREMMDQLIEEELHAVLTHRRLNEMFGKHDFASALSDIMQALQGAEKKIEKAHEMAPPGPAKAIVAGLHSDLFNKIAEFRDHIRQLQGMSSHRGT